MTRSLSLIVCTLAVVAATLGSSAAQAAEPKGAMSSTDLGLSPPPAPTARQVVTDGASMACACRPPCGRACDKEFALLLPVWVPGVSGTFANGNTNVDISRPEDAAATDSKVLTKFEFAFVGGLEARWGRFICYGDVFGVRLKQTADFRVNGLDAEGSIAALLARAVAGWRVVKAPDPCCPWSTDVDVFAGARLYHVEAELRSPAPLAFSRTKTWVDPLVGARARLKLPGRFDLIAAGDVGGFGLGSDLSWSASIDLAYHFSRTWSLSLGYGWLSVDYDIGENNDRFVYNLDLRGPRLVLGIHF